MKKIIFPLSTICFLFFIFSIPVGIASCEKEVIVRDTVTVNKKECPASILGLWVGTYTADLLPNDPARYYSFIIKPNGELIVESHPVGNTPYFGNGTWALNGNTLTCNIVYPSSPQGYSVSQTSTAIYDSIGSRLISGVWINNGPPGGTGKFVMQEIK